MASTYTTQDEAASKEHLSSLGQLPHSHPEADSVQWEPALSAPLRFTSHSTSSHCTTLNSATSSAKAMALHLRAQKQTIWNKFALFGTSRSCLRFLANLPQRGRAQCHQIQSMASRHSQDSNQENSRRLPTEHPMQRASL
jgi:hypothetical protein